MAYAAVESLMQTIEQLLHHSQDDQLSNADINVPDEAGPLIDSLYNKATSLRTSLIILFPAPQSKMVKVNALEELIICAVHKAADIIEFYISERIAGLSSGSDDDDDDGSSHQDPNLKSANFLKDMEMANAEIAPIVEKARKLQRELEQARLLLSGGFKSVVSSTAAGDNDAYAFGDQWKGRKTIGQDEDWRRLVNRILEGSDHRAVIPIVGMAGIGKTTLARSVYDHYAVKFRFPLRGWVTVSKECQIEEIFAMLLNNVSLYNQINWGNFGDQYFKLRNALHKVKYLVVIDDIWDTEALHKILICLPDDKVGSRIIVTTRDAVVARHPNEPYSTLRLLNKYDSWELLSQEAFRGAICPPHLEKTRKKIAEKCGGLPMLIKLVGDQLFKKEKTVAYWTTVAQDVHSLANRDAAYMEILFRSYSHLPPHLKGCFLYMGAFLEDSEISASKLSRLDAEGLVRMATMSPYREWRILSHSGESVKVLARSYLKDLADKCLILADKWSSNGRGMKTCRVHSAYWHLCIREATRDDFFRLIKSYPDDMIPSDLRVGAIDSQLRRLCVHNNVLFGLEDARKLMASVSGARSLLCTGPHHPYPLPECFEFRLLRVLDALTIHFYYFPQVILKLVRLRYLAITFNRGELPGSVCNKLQDLQFLIVRRHLLVKSPGGAPCYMPIEIWNMKQLMHLQFMGSDMPTPHADVIICANHELPNLLTLSDVGPHSCTKEVLERIPNLKKLGVRIELQPQDDVSAASSALLCHTFEHLALLSKLQSFKCVVVNPPDLGSSSVVARPSFDSINLPSSLSKLSLSGLRLQWEEMKFISRQLPNMEVLKLQSSAFEGPEWETCSRREFPHLKFLLLEDLDIKFWMAEAKAFPRLKCLIIRHCYKLEKIPVELGMIWDLQLIEVVDCSRAAMDSALKMKEQVNRCEFRILSSWKGKKLTKYM